MPEMTLLPSDIQLDKKAPLANYTTFRLGGPCPVLLNCRTPQQLEQAVVYLSAQHIPFILIGGGSNLVVSDEGVDCHVIRYVNETPLIERDGDELIVAASTSLDALALYAAQAGLEGVNYTSGIPGTVGGAVVGNAGAFGHQIGDVLVSATLLTKAGIKKNVKAKDLGFRYRHSILKETEDIVVSVRLQVKPADSKKLLAERDETLALRKSKHPDLTTHPCAGSVFRNIEPTSKAGKRQATGWFLDQVDGRSLQHGGALIFDKHANIIVKGPGCKAQDVYELSQKMASLAKEKFNLKEIKERVQDSGILVMDG
ncbi:MAG: UDP-N-acetylmuramate dehydrogenase, partial [Candidatus Omnitrophota bacterium]|nr:UDP-N-acetylmuramate dehydrogenase [Candidatus Omnitrophota bacterium]